MKSFILTIITLALFLSCTAQKKEVEPGKLSNSLFKVIEESPDTASFNVLVYTHKPPSSYDRYLSPDEKVRRMENASRKSQEGILEFLHEDGDAAANINSDWMTNTITFRGTKKIIYALSLRNDVRKIVPDWRGNQLPSILGR